MNTKSGFWITRLVLFIVTLLLFIRCQQDDNSLESEILVTINDSSSLIIKNISKKEIISNNKLASFLEKSISTTVTTRNSENRDILSMENYDFSIYKDVARYVETEDYHSYTFKLVRDLDETGLANLLISSRDGEAYKSYLVYYEISTEEKYDLESISSESLGDRTYFVQLDLDGDEILGSRVSSFNIPVLNDCPPGLCCDTNTSISPGTGWVVITYEIVDCPEAPDSEIGLGNDPTTGGGGGGANETDSDDNGTTDNIEDILGLQLGGGGGGGNNDNNGNEDTSYNNNQDDTTNQDNQDPVNTLGDEITSPLVVVDPIIEEEINEVIAMEVQNSIEDNPFLLLDIDCNQIENWQVLAQHTAPEEILGKIDNLPGSIFNDFELQTLENAGGTIVNMDYFSVNVTNLPNIENTFPPEQHTPDSFLDYFRRNINTFVEGSSFDPFCETTTELCEQETELWNSDNPEGAIIFITIGVDDGSVVCSEFEHDHWNFMTLNAPESENHPVSGTRQFGYEMNNDGSLNFYVRGVDRFDNNLIENLAYGLSFGNPFFGSDNLWDSFQEKMNAYVNNHGGSSSINTPIKNRPDWNKVNEVLRGQKPISDLGCD